MKVPRCKGMRDILPEDMAKFRHIEDVFRNTTGRWGYEEVRTPTLEYLHLFTATGTLTPGMLGRVYTFLDWDGWSGERVVLRPEGTIPIARMCAEHLHSKGKDGVKRYSYVGNVFTFEGTGKEHREQWQCGVELIGGGGSFADIELVMLASEVIESLGVGALEVGLSHAGLIKALIAELGLGNEEQNKIFDQVLEGDFEALGKVKTKDKELKKALKILLDVQGSSAGYLENISAMVGKSLAGLEPSLNDFIGIAKLLTAAGCKYHIDISSGAGFEYYTGAMFQFYVSGRKVGGGGRYDDLISLVGGPRMPASGFALYVDKLMDMLKIETETGKKILLNIDKAKDEEVAACLKLARSLRKSGYVVAFELKGKSADDFRWIVTPAGKGRFKLVDRSTLKQIEVSSATEIKKAVEGAR
ncbi:MAG: HisS family protein [Chloroflexota bacterium]|nr:HisS family protein [Chloroflexota bacterium]